MPRLDLSSAEELRIANRNVLEVRIANQTIWPSTPGDQPLDLWVGPHNLDAYVAQYPQFGVVTAQPIAQWVGDWQQNGAQWSAMRNYRDAANGKIVVTAIYAIPNRDTGGYSAGGFANRTEYLGWLGAVQDGAGDANVWYILEPDALGHLPSFAEGERVERLETIRDAVDVLKQGPNAKVFIDCSHWLTPDEAADVLVAANINNAEGFSLNVSNFRLTSEMHAYGTDVVAALASRGYPGKQYVIDTSRNGNGPLTEAFGPDGAPWLSAGIDWCNPPGRGLGLSPRVPAGYPNCAALLYIKIIGESDGDEPGTVIQSSYFGENGPPAGSVWPAYMQDMLDHTNMSNLSL